MQKGQVKNGWKIIEMKKLRNNGYKFVFQHTCGEKSEDTGPKVKYRKLIKPGELYCCASTSSSFNARDHFHHPPDFPYRCYKCEPEEVCPTCGRGEYD